MGPALTAKAQRVPLEQASPTGLPYPMFALWNRLHLLAEVSGRQQEKVQEAGLLELLMKIGMPLTYVLSDMKHTCICLEPARDLREPLERTLDKVG